MSDFRPLPWDFQRCEPVKEHWICHQCPRWFHHPEQTFGPRTPISMARPGGNGCDLSPCDHAWIVRQRSIYYADFKCTKCGAFKRETWD